MQQSFFSEQLVLSDELFTKFKELVYDTSGIILANSKNTMLSARLVRRLRALNYTSFEQYYEYIQDGQNFQTELQSLLNVVTTNKTDFYREKHHFENLTDYVVPVLRSEHLLQEDTSLNIWSAGCSSGEEPYTISMELAEVMGAKKGNFKILATDISTKVIHTAMDAVYCEQCIAPIPDKIKRRYLLRGTGKHSGQYKVAPEITKHVNFGKLNFTCDDYKIPEKMHVIFCRNVLIYFDSHTRAAIIQKLCSQLVSGGFLFIGHSETLVAKDYQLEKIFPTVYRRKR